MLDLRRARDVKLATCLLELLRLRGHALGHLANLLGDLHRAELGAAHRAEVGDLRAIGRQRLVVILERRIRIERQVELILPPELEARLAERIVAEVRAGVALREVRRVRRDFVRDHARLHVVAIGEPEVLLRRDVAEHRGAEPADHRGADRRGDVVVAGRDIGDQRPQRIERRFAAQLHLEIDVLLDLVHPDMAGAFDHRLDIVLPRDLRELAERLELRQLGAIVRVRRRARAQAIAERERDIVLFHHLADALELGVEEVLLVVREAPLRHDRTAARHDAGHPVRGQRDVRHPDARVDREVIDALLRLLDQGLDEQIDVQLLGIAIDLLEALVDRHRADGHRRVANDPLAGLVDVLARREIHDGVRAPLDRPAQLVDLLADRRRHGGVADVRVDLHEELRADDHRLALGVVDVRRQDGATTRDLVAHELRRHVLADRDELHLRRDDAAPRVVHLRPVARVTFAEARIDPRLAELRQPLVRVVPLGTARIVDIERRLTARERDPAHRDAQAAFFDEDFLRRREVRDDRQVRDRVRNNRKFRAHLLSLRRHYPGQVHGVARQSL